jgi:hypothetical protein
MLKLSRAALTDKRKYMPALGNLKRASNKLEKDFKRRNLTSTNEGGKGSLMRVHKP